MWHIGCAIFLGQQILFRWELPSLYPNQDACLAQIQHYQQTWETGNSLHQIGYKCTHDPLES